jgi:hypothetical protein
MRALTMQEIEQVGGGMSPTDGITSVGVVVGIAALAGVASAPVLAVGVVAIGAMAAIDAAQGSDSRHQGC